MPKIIHAADFHLDSAFAGLEPDKARTRRGELRELPDRLAELVLAERVELVLLSGDLFDSERVYPETVAWPPTSRSAKAQSRNGQQCNE